MRIIERESECVGVKRVVDRVLVNVEPPGLTATSPTSSKADAEAAMLDDYTDALRSAPRSDQTRRTYASKSAASTSPGSAAPTWTVTRQHRRPGLEKIRSYGGYGRNPGVRCQHRPG